MSPQIGQVLKVEHEDSLLVLTLSRPENANALSPDLVEELIRALTSAEGIRFCLLRGSGKHFCAGFDLADLTSLSDGDLLWRFVRIEHLLQLVQHAPFPTMALAQGQVVGAGADLFAACWRRVAAPNVKIRMPGWNFEVALGTRRLTRLIGTQGARDLLIDTKVCAAEEAMTLGLASDIVHPDDWPDVIQSTLKRTRSLSLAALRDMMALTVTDTRAQDMASLVATAGRPGLKDRIKAYRAQVLSAKREDAKGSG
ncbi:MAG: enoyl-CoA hydratase/isomerase family protein [Pseudomonadota bacterium]